MRYICDYASDVSKAIGKGLVGAMVGFAALTGIDATLETKLSVKPAIAQQKSEEITEKEIEHYMSMKTVEEILKGTDVKYVTYQGNGRTNVHQLLDTGKPALALFYSNTWKGDNTVSKRNAIIFRKLAEKYGAQINFIGYNIDENSGAEKTRYDGIASDKNLSEKSGFDIPSIVMFSNFDLLKCETPQRNDGRLKQIDILRGGPETDKQIPNNLNNFDKWWVKLNLLEPLKNKTYRMNNSYKLNKYAI